MQFFQGTIIVVALMLGASASFAAKPTSIAFKASSETADGTPFANYTVKCSDGKEVAVIAWENRNKWCLATNDKLAENCSSKQISTVKAACQSS